MSYEPITVTESVSLDRDIHAGTTVVVDAAAGLTLTLPAAEGLGDEYDIFLLTSVTSNAVVIAVADATDVMAGQAILGQDSADTAVLFETAATSDTITLNGSTKGGLKGCRVRLKDVAPNTWATEVIGAATGTEESPFSADVS